MSSTQMLKGILEGCLLAVISEGEIYGYEMTKVLAGYGFSDISEGSIYPILLRMQKEKMGGDRTKTVGERPEEKILQTYTPWRSGASIVHRPLESIIRERQCTARKKTEGEVKLCYQRTCKTYWTR
ncbi:PadR family transcriptional regulator [Bacillus licheniformis]